MYLAVTFVGHICGKILVNGCFKLDAKAALGYKVTKLLKILWKCSQCTTVNVVL